MLQKMVCFVDRIVIYTLSENCKDYSVFARLIHSLLLSLQVYSLPQTNPCALHRPDSLVSWLPVELANGKAPACHDHEGLWHLPYISFSSPTL